MGPKDIYELVETLLRRVFNDRIPPQVADLVTIGLLFAIAAGIVFGLFIALGKALKVYREDIRPCFYNEADRRRAEKRRRFADHVESEIRRINNAEEWGDYKFAELEAEVEAEGERHGFFLFRKRSGLRREKSLSRALRHSKERLVLVEGDPGSGKSVALRFLTTTLARAAMKARNTTAVIPLYINLKNIERRPGIAVDAELIRSHVLKTLNRPNTRNITEFLEEEFDRGMRDGTWLFLFDSFDEIPDILSATSADTTVRDYANAIADFLLTLNTCRGIVASRYFRGPGGLAWPRFRILALSDAYRRNLIRRSDLAPAAARSLIGDLELAQGDLNVMSRNPMFLGLLCEYMHTGQPFPDNAHVVFENYVTTRLERDESKLQVRFGTSAAPVRLAAEQAAFCMASAAGLGLSPSRTELTQQMKAQGFDGNADVMLDAIEYIKLARSDEQDQAKTFTFAHRRFQEYFATCVVIRQPDLVPAKTLLTDARWRETAVVLLQTQTNVSALLEEAERWLGTVVDEIEASVPETPAFDRIESVRRSDRIQFPWPPLALHLLGLLQSGYRGHPERLPERIRELAGRIVVAATWHGALSDRKWVLEVAEPAPQDVLTWALRDAYRDGSTWLGDGAYRQASALREIPPDIAKEIRRGLILQLQSGRLHMQRHSTRAYLLRLPNAREFVKVHQLLLVVLPIDIALVAIIMIGYAWAGQIRWEHALLSAIVAAPWYRALSDIAWSQQFLHGISVARLWVIALIASSFSHGASWGHSLLALLSPDIAMLLSCALVAIFWAPIALVAAESGRLGSMAIWPLLSLYPLVRGFQLLRDDTKGALRQLVSRIATVILAIGAPLGFVFLVDKIEIPKIIQTAAFVLFGGLTVIALCFLAIGYVKDSLKFARYCRHKEPWSANALLDAAMTIGAQWQRVRFVRHIRRFASLAQTEADEADLRRYALTLENTDDVRQRRNLSPLIDELNILADQMRAQRANSPASS